MEHKIFLYGLSIITTVSISDMLKKFPELLTLLLILILTDIILGLLQAIKNRKLSTKKIYAGGLKKTTILIIITISYFIDLYLISDPANYIFNSSILYYVLLELISITKNANKLGVKLPKAITTLIKNMESEDL